MLKIKDNVDLKELEKYGFKVDRYYYGVQYGIYKIKSDEQTSLNLYVNEKDKILSIENIDFNDGDIFELDIFYNLIKADLVEKVKK